jgi:succinoglycan biosynthesis transport protein ExoP
LAVVALHARMRELLRSIKDEMRKIQESYKSDYQIAQAREQSLSDSLRDAIGRSQIKDKARVQLQELESGAQTSKTLYDNFLQRYKDGTQQESFPISEARVISFADTPLTKSFPKTSLVLLLATALGLVLSIGGASLRELTDRVFRSSDQVEDILHVKCLAMLPLLKSAPATHPENSAEFEALQLLPSPDRIMRQHAKLDHVLDNPLSQFSEALKAVKVAMDFNGILKSKRVIGITSTLPHEGKSTIAANFAQLIAHAGASVILIDADLRNPSLSRQLAPECPGLVEVVVGLKSIDDVLMTYPRSGLKLLPAGASAQVLHTNELLASDAMRNLVDELRRHYDYVIVDLPPLIPVIDARVTTNFTDTFIYVLEWGKTPIDAAKHSLTNAPEIFERILGVVINKVDMAAIRSYERYRSDLYHKKYHGHYGGSIYTKNV